MTSCTSRPVGRRSAKPAKRGDAGHDQGHDHEQPEDQRPLGTAAVTVCAVTTQKSYSQGHTSGDGRGSPSGLYAVGSMAAVSPFPLGCLEVARRDPVARSRHLESRSDTGLSQACHPVQTRAARTRALWCLPEASGPVRWGCVAPEDHRLTVDLEVGDRNGEEGPGADPSAVILLASPGVATWSWRCSGSPRRSSRGTCCRTIGCW